MNQQVGIVGVGNMGEALLSGLLKSGTNSQDIIFAQQSDERAAVVEAKYGISRRSLAEVAAADVILLCVKPKDVAAVCSEMAPHMKKDSVLVSVAAGKTIEGIQSIVGDGIDVVRVMPNTPTSLGKGAAGISFGSNIAPAQADFVRNLFAAGGSIVEVPEELQSAVTATSGSGPAYFFAFVEAMVEGGKKLGLSEEVATKLAIQTIVGAAAMLDESGKSATQLRENVTSPNGTTHAALTVFQESHLQEIVANAMAASAKRSQELA